MRTGGGTGLIVAGTGLMLVTVFVLWRRVPAWTALVAVSAFAVAIGAGGLLLLDDPGPADWAVALGVLAVGAPIHLRLVFGAPGPRA
jgi:hypothetical protein